MIVSRGLATKLLPGDNSDARNFSKTETRGEKPQVEISGLN